MKRAFILATLLLTIPVLAWAASNLPANTTTATVLIVDYDTQGHVLGWDLGSL